MKAWIAATGASACVAILISACGGGDSAGAPPPAAAAAASGMSLDTEQVLVQAREASETSEPYAVNGGAVSFDDTSDTSEPLGINGA
jgi:hypothetical protein